MSGERMDVVRFSDSMWVVWILRMGQHDRSNSVLIGSDNTSVLFRG